MGRRQRSTCFTWVPSLLLLLLVDGVISNIIRSAEYGVVIDAGSTGSRVRVYRWEQRFYRTEVPQIEEIYNHKLKTGISSFASRVDELELYVLGLLEEAKGHVPEDKYPETPLYLMATAGMRLLEEEVINTIMDTLNDLLDDPTKNPFLYEPYSARVLSGEEEGAFAWIALNYLRGYFTGETDEYMGVLELGGASTQIAFLPEGSILASKFNVDIGGRRYPLYVHSYIYRGNEEEYLLRKYPDTTSIPDPCRLAGDDMLRELHGRNITFEGIGDADQCSEIVNDFIYRAEPYRCQPKPCAIGPIYQPSIPEDRMFYAIGGFKYPVQAFGLSDDDENPAPGEILEKARRFCQLDLDTALAESGDRRAFVSNNCKMGLFVATLLTKAYGFSQDSQQVKYASKINNHKISWTIGALLYEISRDDVTYDQNQYLMAIRSSAHSYHHPLHLGSFTSLTFIIAFIFFGSIS